jgi:hypothetical protein
MNITLTCRLKSIYLVSLCIQYKPLYTHTPEMITYCIGPECKEAVRVFDLAPLCPKHLVKPTVPGKVPSMDKIKIAMEDAFHLTPLGVVKRSDGAMGQFLVMIRPKCVHKRGVAMTLHAIKETALDNVKHCDHKGMTLVYQEIADNVITFARRAMYSRYIKRSYD